MNQADDLGLLRAVAAQHQDRLGGRRLKRGGEIDQGGEVAVGAEASGPDHQRVPGQFRRFAQHGVVGPGRQRQQAHVAAHRKLDALRFPQPFGGEGGADRRRGDHRAAGQHQGHTPTETMGDGTETFAERRVAQWPWRRQSTDVGDQGDRAHPRVERGGQQKAPGLGGDNHRVGVFDPSHCAEGPTRETAAFAGGKVPADDLGERRGADVEPRHGDRGRARHPA